MNTVEFVHELKSKSVKQHRMGLMNKLAVSGMWAPV